MHHGTCLFIEKDSTQRSNERKQQIKGGKVLHPFAVGWPSPRNDEIDTRKQQPANSDPCEAKEQTLDKDADKYADCYNQSEVTIGVSALH
jgi:hypothetical protein